MNDPSRTASPRFIREQAPGVRLAFVGDLMLGRGVSRALKGHPPEWIWGDVLPLLRGSTAVIGNLESPITSSTRRWRRTCKMFHFRADPDAIDVLTCGNIRFVNLANNHMMDFRARGLIDTMRSLDGAGISYAGAGRSRAEAARPTELALPGLAIGLLSATDTMTAFAAGPNRPGTHVITIDPASPDLSWVRDSAANLRQRGADVVVLTLHWGPNMRWSPRRKFRAFAQAAIDCGVDVIHGHSAHIVQGIEIHRGRPILYDTGNFLDDYWKFPFLPDDVSFAFLLDLHVNGLQRLRMIPIRLHPAPLHIATGDDRRTIIDRLRRSSARFGTELVESADGLEMPENLSVWPAERLRSDT
jgi:poly-gamma-glutamate capsule biosynthesis protein CapA/YwtB (metallophosphatase superfamily)